MRLPPLQLFPEPSSLIKRVTVVLTLRLLLKYEIKVQFFKLAVIFLSCLILAFPFPYYTSLACKRLSSNHNGLASSQTRPKMCPYPLILINRFKQGLSQSVLNGLFSVYHPENMFVCPI